MILNYVIGGFTGIIIYQIICMLVYIFTNENDNVMSIMGMLIPFAIWNYLMGPIIYQIVLIYYRKNYNCYRFCVTQTDGTISRDMDIFYLNTKDIKTFSQNANDKYHIELVTNGKDFKSVPYKNDVYKGQEYFKGWEMSRFKNC